MQRGCVAQFIHAKSTRSHYDDASDNDERHRGGQLPKRNVDANGLRSLARHQHLNRKACYGKRHQLPSQTCAQQAGVFQAPKAP